MRNHLAEEVLNQNMLSLMKVGNVNKLQTILLRKE